MINCIVIDDEPVAREILESHISQVQWLNLAGTCKNAIEAFKIINTHKVDLLFLDINMPEISGLSFARSINKEIKVIFTTAYREYAVDGFDLQAVDYLLKPISFERFMQAVNKFRGETNIVSTVLTEGFESERNEYFFVRADRKMIKIAFNEIQYIESLSDYIKIHLTDKHVITRETISNIEAKLPQNDFIRIHRSFVVAMKAIDSFTTEYVEVSSHQLPISRSYKDAVLKKLDAGF